MLFDDKRCTAIRIICSGVLSNAIVSDGFFSDKRVEHFLNVPIDKMALLPRLALVLPKPGLFIFFISIRPTMYLILCGLKASVLK